MTQLTLLAWDARRSLRAGLRDMAVSGTLTLLVLLMARDDEMRRDVLLQLVFVSLLIVNAAPVLWPRRSSGREPPSTLLLAGCSVRSVLWSQGLAAALHAMVALAPLQVAVAALFPRPPRAFFYAAAGIGLWALETATIAACSRARRGHGRRSSELWGLAVSTLAHGALFAALGLAVARRVAELDGSREDEVVALLRLFAFTEVLPVLLMTVAFLPVLVFAVEDASRTVAAARSCGSAAPSAGAAS